MKSKSKVIFICTHNSARSQIGEAFLKNLYDDNYYAYSAGITPGSLNPNVIEVMQEVGIDISHHHAKSLDRFENQEFDLAVTLCDGASEACPVFMGAEKTIHHGFEDPSQYHGSREEILQATRKLRDAIKDWIEIYFQK